MIKEKKQIETYLQIFWISAITICGAFLFYISLEARHTSEQLGRTQALINEEIKNIDILKSEYAYLSRPESLERLLDKNLTLKAHYKIAARENYKNLEDFGIIHHPEPILAHISVQEPNVENLANISSGISYIDDTAISNLIKPQKKPIALSVRVSKKQSNTAARKSPSKENTNDFMKLLGGLTSN